MITTNGSCFRIKVFVVGSGELLKDRVAEPRDLTTEKAHAPIEIHLESCGCVGPGVRIIGRGSWFFSDRWGIEYIVVRRNKMPCILVHVKDLVIHLVVTEYVYESSLILLIL
jgi:hypothetical protein